MRLFIVQGWAALATVHQRSETAFTQEVRERGIRIAGIASSIALVLFWLLRCLDDLETHLGSHERLAEIAAAGCFALVVVALLRTPART